METTYDITSDYYGVKYPPKYMLIFENEGDRDLVAKWDMESGRLQFLSRMGYPATDVGFVPWEKLRSRMWVITRCRNLERAAMLRQALQDADGAKLTAEVFGGER